MEDPCADRDREQASEGLWLRFLLGVGLLTRRWRLLSDNLRDWSQVADAQEPEDLPDSAGARRWHLLIGALGAGRERVIASAARARGAAASLSRQAATVGAWLAWADPGGSFAETARSVSDATSRQLTRWELRGKREVRRSQAVANRFLITTADFWLSRAADSPQLQDLIREQSAGVGRTVLEDVREQGSRADEVVESGLRRLLRRPQPSPTGR